MSAALLHEDLVEQAQQTLANGDGAQAAAGLIEHDQAAVEEDGGGGDDTVGDGLEQFCALLRVLSARVHLCSEGDRTSAPIVPGSDLLGHACSWSTTSSGVMVTGAASAGSGGSWGGGRSGRSAAARSGKSSLHSVSLPLSSALVARRTWCASSWGVRLHSGYARGLRPLWDGGVESAQEHGRAR